jgi:hypothetical protein
MHIFCDQNTLFTAVAAPYRLFCEPETGGCVKKVVFSFCNTLSVPLRWSIAEPLVCRGGVILTGSVEILSELQIQSLV